MKQLRGILFGLGCVGTAFCIAVGLIGYRQSSPERWTIVPNAEIKNSYVTNRIIKRTMPAKWAPVIEAAYEFSGKRTVGTVELDSYDTKSEAERFLASHISSWSGQVYVYRPDPARAALAPQSQDYFLRILLYGIPFYLLLAGSIIGMLKKKNEA